MPHNYLTCSKERFNVRVKDFGSIKKYTCFSHPVFNPNGVPPERTEKEKQIIRECNEWNKAHRTKAETPRADSVKRAKDKAFEIAFANDFKYFVTLTLDQSKIDRYDTKEILKKLNVWLRNKVQRKRFQYIIFPEYHKKDKAIHFHGLCSGDLVLTDSGKKTKSGQVIYNTESWPYGFSTVMEIYGPKEQVTNYVMKYITKDNNKIFGKFYLSGGKDLKREVPTSYFNDDFEYFVGERYRVGATKDFVKYRTDFTAIQS